MLISLYGHKAPHSSTLSGYNCAGMYCFDVKCVHMTWDIAAIIGYVTQSAISVAEFTEIFFSPLRSIPADGFIAWRNFCLSFRLSNLANKSGVATLSVTKNCSMGAIYLTWQGCFRRFLISGAELSKYDFFLQNIAILNTFSSSVNW